VICEKADEGFTAKEYYSRLDDIATTKIYQTITASTIYKIKIIGNIVHKYNGE